MRAIVAPKYTEDGKSMVSVDIAIQPDPASGQEEIDLHRFLALLKTGGFLGITPSMIPGSRVGRLEIVDVAVNYN